MAEPHMLTGCLMSPSCAYAAEIDVQQRASKRLVDHILDAGSLSGTMEEGVHADISLNPVGQAGANVMADQDLPAIQKHY